MSVYLDHNASTPMAPEVAELMARISAEPGNAASAHSFGRHKRSLIEAARRDILQSLGADETWDLIFCSGATAANNLILRSFDYRFVGASEHASVRAVPAVPAVPVLATDGGGRISEQTLHEALQGIAPPFLVSLQAANSETGILQDLSPLAAIVKEHGGFFHSDMVQWIGKLPLSLCDYPSLSAVTLSGHKFGAPSAIGALLYRKEVPLRTLIYGGGQEQGLFCGTENAALIAGLAKACELLPMRLDKMAAVEKLRNAMEAQLQQQFSVLHIVGKEQKRLPNTSCLILPEISADSFVVAMDLAGFAVSAGSACSSGLVKKMSALTAMGYSESQNDAALRVSLGIDTTHEQILAFTEAYVQFANRRHHAA